MTQMERLTRFNEGLVVGGVIRRGDRDALVATAEKIAPHLAPAARRLRDVMDRRCREAEVSAVMAAAECDGLQLRRW